MSRRFVSFHFVLAVVVVIGVMVVIAMVVVGIVLMVGIVVEVVVVVVVVVLTRAIHPPIHMFEAPPGQRRSPRSREVHP